jgi:hypothetical protein
VLSVGSSNYPNVLVPGTTSLQLEQLLENRFSRFNYF